MRVETREVGDVVVFDLFGPLPRTLDEAAPCTEAFRHDNALNARYVLVLHDTPRSDEIPVGPSLLIGALQKAGVPRGYLGNGPFIHIVCNDETRKYFPQVIDSPLRVFSTEHEAIKHLKARNLCLPTLIVFGALLVAGLVWLIRIIVG